MGEWRRVWNNPRRTALMLGIAVLGVLLYLVGRMDNIHLESWGKMVDKSHFVAGLVEEYRGMELEEAGAKIKEKGKLMESVLLWTSGWALEGATEEDVAKLLVDEPDLVELVHDKTALRLKLRDYDRAYMLLEEQVEYLLDYPVYLEKIQKQAQQQSQTTIFGDPNSFSYRNLQETAAQFAKLQDVQVEFGNNQAVESWLDYKLADYLYAIVLVVVVLSFLEERKKGLWSTIRSCRYGRLRLGVVRAGILLGMAAIYTFLLYGVNLLIALRLDGGWNDLGRALQSLGSFKTCALRISVGEWIVQYLLVKVFSGFLIGLLLWCILGFISNIQFSLTVLGGVLLGEYVLFSALPVQSIFNPVKYFNLFSYVHTSALYTEYLNINLFQYPFGIRGLALWALPILILLGLAGVLLIQRNRYPDGNRDWLGKIAAVWSRVWDIPRRFLSIGGVEAYKTLILEWSLVLLLVLFFFSENLSFYSYTTGEGSHWYQAYLEDAEGPIDESMDEYMAHACDLAQDANPEVLSGLSQLEGRIAELRLRAEEGGYDPWLVDGSVYEVIYGNEERMRLIQRQNGAVALIFVLLSCAGLVAYERGSGVRPLLRSLKRGRRDIYRRKICMAALMATAVWLMVYGREIMVFMKEYQPSTLAAPVQNLDMLRNFPWKISIGTYMGLIYGIRWIMLLATAGAALWISSCCQTLEMAYMVNLGVLGVPALLFVLGISIFGWVSPVVPIASVELLNSLGRSWSGLAPWVLWLLLGGLALLASRRKWVL